MAKLIEGEKRGKPGLWLLDFYGSDGRRHVRTFKTKAEAQDGLARALDEQRERRAARRMGVDTSVTVSAYAEKWLRLVKSARKPRTLEVYRLAVGHVVREFGAEQVRALGPIKVRSWALAMLDKGASRSTVRLRLAVLRAMLAQAVGDQITGSNPASGTMKALGLARQQQRPEAATGEPRPEAVKALTEPQLAAFLAAAAPTRYGVLFLALALTGMRLGEALGLRWTDVDIPGRQITIARTLSKDRRTVGSTKSGKARKVDMAGALAAALESHPRGGGPLVFSTSAGTPLDASKVAKAMTRLLRDAGLPQHFSPHSLRHTFASIHLSRGESIKWVQEMLGHASLSLTSETYGSWLRSRPTRGGADALGHLTSGADPAAPVTQPVTGRALAPDYEAEVRAVVDSLAVGPANQ